MTARQALDRRLVREQSFFQVLEEVYAQQYTGMLIVHCHDGQPKTVEFPGQQVRLVAPGAPADPAVALPTRLST
jgi:hypothetical protein